MGPKKFSLFGVARLTLSALVSCMLLMPERTALAQQTTGTPGSPGATTTIDGRYLPAPPQKFEGDINVNAAQLLIMTDDVGFAAPSTFGGVIPTPTLDRVAAMGLRYTAFHTTALCSPTRAITRWAPASWSIKRPVIPVTTALSHETRSPSAKS